MNRLNTGQPYNKPYQSAYASVRQCLFSNAGISHSSLTSQLRHRAQQKGGLVERIGALQGLALDDASKSAKRHCPACAHLLYHCGVFEYPWLTHCPIHGCALTRTCPTCGNPWPTLEQLTKRPCAHCGIPTLATCSPDITEPVDVARYEPIAWLLKLTHKESVHDVRLSLRELYDPFSRSYALRLPLTVFTSNSAYMLTVRAHAHQPAISKRLKILNIREKNVSEHTCMLSHVFEDLKRAHTGQRNARATHDILPPNWVTQCECQVINRCLSWIDHYAGPSHVVRIRCYRHFSFHDFAEAGGVCPYCLALSLWFYAVNIDRYGDYYQTRAYDFPFLEEMQANLHYLVGLPLIRWQGQDYIPSQAFDEWFYHYSLELFFVRCYQVALALCHIIHLRSLSNWDLAGRVRLLQESLESARYGAYFSEQRLHFFVVSPHPLARIAGGLPTHLRACNTVDQGITRHFKTASPSLRFCESIPAQKIGIEHYHSLCEAFQDFIAHNFVRYAQGTTPFHDDAWHRRMDALLAEMDI